MGAAIHRPEYFKSDRAEIFDRVFGDDIDYCRRESPWTLAREQVDRLEKKVIRLHVGEHDERLREKNIEFHTLLDSLGLKHEFSVVPNAGHNGGQVLDNVADPWAFYRNAFGMS